MHATLYKLNVENNQSMWSIVHTASLNVVSVTWYEQQLSRGIVCVNKGYMMLIVAHTKAVTYWGQRAFVLGL